MRRPLFRTHRLSRAPEAHIATFAFLLNYPWEMLQAPLFEGLSSGAHWEQVKLGLWDYAPTMPLLPGAKIGLGPVLQWLILPPLIVWFARNQVMGLSRKP